MTAKTSKRTPGGEALFDVIWAVAAVFFRMRAVGAREGMVTAWGAGTLGLRRSLKTDGPSTVPQIARARPVARQRIQKLANELAEAGLIEFVDNPAHRRSKLLRLTADGHEAHDALMARLADLAETLAGGMDPAALRTTADTLMALRTRLGDFLQAEDDPPP